MCVCSCVAAAPISFIAEVAIAASVGPQRSHSPAAAGAVGLQRLGPPSGMLCCPLAASPHVQSQVHFGEPLWHGMFKPSICCKTSLVHNGESNCLTVFCRPVAAAQHRQPHRAAGAGPAVLQQPSGAAGAWTSLALSSSCRLPFAMNVQIPCTWLRRWCRLLCPAKNVSKLNRWASGLQDSIRNLTALQHLDLCHCSSLPALPVRLSFSEEFQRHCRCRS